VTTKSRAADISVRPQPRTTGEKDADRRLDLARDRLPRRLRLLALLLRLAAARRLLGHNLELVDDDRHVSRRSRC
jgi:hypothetical protein